MAGVIWQIPFTSFPNPRSKPRVPRPRCCSGSPKKNTPAVLKLAVGGVTELLRLFSAASSSFYGSTQTSYRSEDEIDVSDVDDLMEILKSDYESAYFVTGIFTSAIYVDDCIFEDPTISFQGTELYKRNLNLLVPFFNHPSIELQKMEKGEASGRNFILATWKLRTYLKLPWRPLISISGSTVYELDTSFKIVRHRESWDVSALEAIAQIFA